jgi:hypothetical protein
MATNMLDNERQVVQTATGPGGMSGPARIDLRMARYEYSGWFAGYLLYCKSTNTDAAAVPSEAEASAAFVRMNAHHAANGW